MILIQLLILIMKLHNRLYLIHPVYLFPLPLLNHFYKICNLLLQRDKIREMIEERDKLQKKAGYYKIYPQTQIIDVTECKTIEESAENFFFYPFSCLVTYFL